MNAAETEHVTLVGVGNDAIRYQREQVYFPFVSGSLGYDCVQCGAKCCHGFGFMLQRERELPVQLTRRPKIRFFLEEGKVESERTLMMQTGPQGCGFLTDDRRCGIHVQDGASYKPETCRLFPFNSLLRTASTLLVAPHMGLCPLVIQPRREAHAASSHANVLRDLTQVPVAAKPTEVRTLLSDEAAALRLERELVDRVQAYDNAHGLDAFFADQLAVTASVTTELGDATSGVLSPLQQIHEFRTSLHAVLGESPSDEVWDDERFVHAVTTCSPILRALLVFRPLSESEDRLSLSDVPLMLVAHATLLSFAIESGAPIPSYQTVSRIFRDNADLLELLTLLCSPRTQRRPIEIDRTIGGNVAERTHYINVLKGMLADGFANPAAALRVSAELPGDPVQRILLLRRLARPLAQVLFSNREVAKKPSRRSVRSWLHECALRTLPANVVAQVLARNPAAAGRGAGPTG